jgi:hypothetical protein
MVITVRVRVCNLPVLPARFAILTHQWRRLYQILFSSPFSFSSEVALWNWNIYKLNDV